MNEWIWVEPQDSFPNVHHTLIREIKINASCLEQIIPTTKKSDDSYLQYWPMIVAIGPHDFKLLVGQWLATLIYYSNNMIRLLPDYLQLQLPNAHRFSTSTLQLLPDYLQLQLPVTKNWRGIFNVKYNLMLK